MPENSDPVSLATKTTGESTQARNAEPEQAKEIHQPRLRFRFRRFILRWLAAGLAVLIGAAIWLPLVHFLFTPRVEDYFSEKDVSPAARAMARHHLRLWADPSLRKREIERMRVSNAEWDFMGRTFLVLALANMALREPAMQSQCLDVMDTIIGETLRLEKEKGIFYFLMGYAQESAFVARPARSLFEDGEIALMMGARRLVAEDERYRAPMRERTKIIFESMQKGPVLCGESYPNECWTFCNAAALAALKMSDALDGTDHREFFRQWLRTAREKLVEPHTGMLISSFTYDGHRLDGPEGSSIWWAAHCLSLIDEEFARDQYLRARRELYRAVLGFGYAREWPASISPGKPDIDSGPIVPGLEASAGSSGQAFLAGNAFGDRRLLGTMLASLRLAGFPEEKDGTLRFHASNQVGDAVLLYSMVLGPLWKKIKEKTQR